MKKDLTLVIMAAGLGSRFGGLKQLTPIGPSGEFIIDYSIYDAIKAGFNKVVFIIKKEHLNDFKETISNRIEKYINISYAFQDNKSIKKEFNIDIKREKPLGTAHAVYCCKDIVKEPFAVISADDFYGRDTFIKAANFLKNNYNLTSTNYAMITCPISKMIGKTSSFKRGICKTENNKLKEIIESSVEYQNNNIVATSLNTNEKFIVEENTPASMSFFTFFPSIFKYIDRDFHTFIKNKNLEKDEFFLPDVVDNIIKNNEGSVEVYNTTSKWYGMTYKKDQEEVECAIKKLIEENVYEKKLWK